MNITPRAGGESVRALNFYSSVYHHNLVLRKKRCTIRLGDKSHKYSEGDIVWVTYGGRFEPRKKILTAVVDRIVVKPLAELTPDDIRGENPDMRGAPDVASFLAEIYDREVKMDEIVSVIFFSEVVEE
jgi:hypothetical protein